MNRVEIAAQQLALKPLQTQHATSPVACTPTLGIFFAAASLSYIWNRNNGFVETDDVNFAGAGESLEQLSGDQLISARRNLSAS